MWKHLQYNGKYNDRAPTTDVGHARREGRLHRGAVGVAVVRALVDSERADTLIWMCFFNVFCFIFWFFN